MISSFVQLIRGHADAELQLIIMITIIVDAAAMRIPLPSSGLCLCDVDTPRATFVWPSDLFPPTPKFDVAVHDGIASARASVYGGPVIGGVLGKHSHTLQK